MLLTSLLTAIVRADGDALVMHVGERPYVVTSGGHVDLSTSGLALEAMSGMLTQLLPEDAMRALSEFGAVEHDLTPRTGFQDRFNMVAARGGDDIWIEIRRKRQLAAAAAPAPVAAAPPPPPPPPPPPVVVAPPASEPIAPPAPEPVARPAPEPVAPPELVAAVAPEPVEIAAVQEQTVTEPDDEPYIIDEPEPERVASDAPIAPIAPVVVAPERGTEPIAPIAPEHRTEPIEPIEPSEPSEPSEPIAPAFARQEPPASFGEASPPVARQESASAREKPAFAREEPAASFGEASSASAREESASAREEPPASYGETGPAVVVPLTRTVRIEVPPRTTSEHQGGVERLLSIAGARGASVLYLTSQSRPFIRVEGEIRAIDGEAPLTSPDVEAAVLELMPESAREAHGRGEPAEWVSEFEGLGRIRCTTFTDYRGAGAIFHLISARPMSVEQLGLPREIQALATESEGLVLVASPRGNGKSTLISALVDQINRNDGGYIISLERQIRIVHENRQSLVSQREVRGSAADAVTVARAALRENPDVLVIEDLSSPDVIQLALDAAGSGLLVFLSVTAGSTSSALMRLIDVFPPERRKAVQAALAERLRGAVSQVLLRKVGGGRLAARELLLTTSGVASLIAEGQIAQLPVAIDSGRKLGMVSLNEALLAFLRKGLIEVREAYRKADDRAGLLALLKRDGADTSVVDRFA